MDLHVSVFHPPLVRWMRKAHGWVGLWGAVLGLVFGFSGIWLNHRALLKIPVPLQQRQQVQLALTDPAPTTPEAMSHWLQATLNLPAPHIGVRIEPARPVGWSERAADARDPSDPQAPRATAWIQPERWMFSFGGPSTVVQVEYWKGNRSVAVSTTSNGLIGALNNLHKGIGMSVGWILLVDTLAGSLILLSLSGTYLWMSTHRARAIGWLVAGAPLAALVMLVLR